MADRSRLRIKFAGIEFEASTLVATTAAVLTLVAGVLSLLQNTARSFDFATKDNAAVASALEKRISTMQADLTRLGSELQTIQQLPSGSRPPAEVQALTVQIGGLDKRLSGIEAAVVESPDKALAVPMLRKDIENLRASYQSEISAAREEVNRLYDLNKWFIGLMITMAIGILGLALGNVVQGRKDPDGAKSSSG